MFKSTPRSYQQEVFILVVVVVAIVFVGIGITVFGSNRVVAAIPNGRFFFDPSSSRVAGCEKSSLVVKIQLSDGSANAADLLLDYNPNQLDVIKVTPGRAFDFHAVNQHNPETGEIRVNALDLIGDGFKGTATFLTIQYRSKPGVTRSSFNIDFKGIGATTDSNIADYQTSQDLLRQVTNADLTFTNPSCVDQEQTPPSSGSSETPVDIGDTTNRPTRPSPHNPSNSEDIIPPPVQVIYDLTYEVKLDSGTYNPSTLPDIDYGSFVTITGSTEPNVRVNIDVSGQYIRDTMSDESGNFSYTLDTRGIILGSHTIQLTADSSNGILFTPVDSFYLVGDTPRGGSNLPAVSMLNSSDRNIAIITFAGGIILTIYGLLLTFELKEVRIRVRSK